MDIILLENIINLGKIGDKVSVKNGYGRNYLLRFNKALRFSKENLEYVNKKKDELNKKNIEAPHFKLAIFGISMASLSLILLPFQENVNFALAFITLASFFVTNTI